MLDPCANTTAPDRKVRGPHQGTCRGDHRLFRPNSGTASHGGPQPVPSRASLGKVTVTVRVTRDAWPAGVVRVRAPGNESRSLDGERVRFGGEAASWSTWEVRSLVG